MSLYNINPLALSSAHWVLERAGFVLAPLYVQYAGFGFLPDALYVDVVLSDGNIYEVREIATATADVVFDLSGGVVDNTTLIDFNLEGSYNAPAGDSILFQLGAAVLDGDILPDQLDIIVEAFTHLVLSGPTITPAQADIVVDAGQMLLEVVPLWYKIPSGIRRDFAVGFQGGQAADTQKRTSWRDAPTVEPQFRAGWAQDEIIDRLVNSGFAGLAGLFTENRVAFARLLRTENAISAAYMAPDSNDTARRTSWASNEPQDSQLVAGHHEPGENDPDDLAIPWGRYEKIYDFSFVMPWAVPGENDTSHRTRWGKEIYDRICTRDYVPPGGAGVALNLETSINDVGDRDHINFYFDSLSYDERCSQQEPSGWRDPFTYEPPVIVDTPRTPNRKAHINMNSALLKRVADNMPLDLATWSAKIDFGSWVWDFSASLNTWSSFAAVEPDENGFQEIEADINGYIFRGLVERASNDEQRQTSFAISGRGPAAELARPYAPQSTYTEEADRGVRQIIEDRLTATGWVLDWQITDFIVPADVYSYHNATPLEAIQQITEALGARIQANRQTKTLQILPRYPVKPWQWDAATPDLIIGESVIMSSNRDWQPGGNYNGVVVSGTNQGVIVKIMRTASGGTEMAPMITNPLIVTTEAATQRGTYELARSGNWQPYTITLPLKTEPEQPSLLLPGHLVQIDRARGSFKAMVTGVKVVAKRQNGLKVRQIVEVMRYRGKPLA